MTRSPPAGWRLASACPSPTASSRPTPASRWRRRRRPAISPTTSRPRPTSFEAWSDAIWGNSRLMPDELLPGEGRDPAAPSEGLDPGFRRGAAQAVTALLSAAAVRERAHEMLGIALEGGVDGWSVDLDRLDSAAELAAKVTREAYPDLDIPFHARWRHFVAGEPRLPRDDPAERARAAFDLVILSVLLDAGTGPGWRFLDPVSGQSFTRSEGLAVASQGLVETGTLGTGGAALAALDGEVLALGFQAGAANPLAGLEGRTALLRRLGAQVLARPDL